MALPEWACAHGSPLFAAAIRTTPDDFRVTENLGWDLSGDGEHDYLRIEKTGANTEWVARQLARFADVPARDVGYAGLKDRHAVTLQWFSVPRWHAPDWSALAIDGVRVLEVQRHDRKLRRGAHRSNSFRIVLRGNRLAAHAAALDQRMARIQEQGVPNYFGEQRFGRDGTNLRLADQWASGKKLPRHARSRAISTIRSYQFNETLDARVTDGTWNALQPGDTANLDGSGSVFAVEAVDAELRTRCAGLDVHPAGELVGVGSTSGNEAWLAALTGARVAPGWRALRVRVSSLEWSVEGDAVTVAFTLTRGAFATAVLREICET